MREADAARRLAARELEGPPRSAGRGIVKRARSLRVASASLVAADDQSALQHVALQRFHEPASAWRRVEAQLAVAREELERIAMRAVAARRIGRQEALLEGRVAPESERALTLCDRAWLEHAVASEQLPRDRMHERLRR